MPKIFESGRMKPGEDRKTYFRLFTGPGTLYPAANSRPKMDMITAGAGASNTWLLAEGKNAVEWTKPDELVVNGGQFPQLGGAYGVGFFVLCADGKSHYVHQDQFSRDALLQLVNPTRAEQVAGWPPN
jgi:hypothetical protein